MRRKPFDPSKVQRGEDLDLPIALDTLVSQKIAQAEDDHNQKRRSVSWAKTRQRLLSHTADALAYLAVTAEDEPETMFDSLINVLQACPDLAQVVISHYIRFLKAGELQALKECCPEANQYIERNQEALLLLAGTVTAQKSRQSNDQLG